MIGLLALADLPFGINLLNDVVVEKSTAYVFSPPKYIARHVKQASFTGNHLVYVTVAPPTTVSDPVEETTLCVWEGKNKVIRSFRENARIDFATIGKDNEAVAAFILPNLSPDQPSSLEVLRFNQGVVSNWKMPAGFMSGGYRAWESDYVQMSWYPKMPDSREEYDLVRQAVLGVTGEPLFLPEKVGIQLQVDGQFIAAELRGEQFYVWRSNQWQPISRLDMDKLTQLYWQAREKRIKEQPATAAEPYTFRSLTVPVKPANPPRNRKELWLATTDQLGPNRILISPDSDWKQATATRMAYIEDGILYAREISTMPRDKYDALAAPAEKALFESYARDLRAAYQQYISRTQGVGPAPEKLKEALAKSVRSVRTLDALKVGAQGEIGRYEGRYGTMPVTLRDPLAWIPKS